MTQDERNQWVDGFNNIFDCQIPIFEMTRDYVFFFVTVTIRAKGLEAFRLCQHGSEKGQLTGTKVVCAERRLWGLYGLAGISESRKY